MARSRAPYRWLLVLTVAGLSGLGMGLAMPRGPVTSGQALALLVVSVLGSEYTLPEKMSVVRGLVDTFSFMYPHWQTIDFRRTAERLEVPVYIFTGKHELAARRDLALAWFKRLRAPIKRLYDYPDSGHATAFEHFQDLHRIMVRIVLPATYRLDQSVPFP